MFLLLERHKHKSNTPVRHLHTQPVLVSGFCQYLDQSSAEDSSRSWSVNRFCSVPKRYFWRRLSSPLSPLSIMHRSITPPRTYYFGLTPGPDSRSGAALAALAAALVSTAVLQRAIFGRPAERERGGGQRARAADGWCGSHYLCRCLIIDAPLK